jgi:hypothetical protein
VGDYDHTSRVRSKKQKVSRLVYDHDHTTGMIRGVLCHRCNTALGWFKDDPTLISKALDYLQNANTGRIYDGNALAIQNEQCQTDQQIIAAYQEKLMQAARRIEKLERQVEVQRQKIGQYHQRFYPSSLAVAEERLLALGAMVNYKRLLKYNEHTVDIGAGAEAWRDFAKSADYDTLAQAILQAQRFYENLEATHSTVQQT